MAQHLTGDAVLSVFPELAWINDDTMREAVAALWVDIAAEMTFAVLQDIPKNTTGEGGRRLVDHIRGVTQMAVSLCDIAKELHGKEYDRDMLVAACLLHDLSKPVEYEPSPDKAPQSPLVVPARSSRIGRNLQHAVYAAHKMLQKGLSPELVNLVITHTHASNRRGTTWEAAALFYADFADSDAGLHEAREKMFSERWKL